MLTVRGSHTVKPAGETPSGFMYISDLDQAIALTLATPVYFYQPRNESVWPIKHVVETLRDSLSKALVIFYPLAGRLNWIDGRPGGRLHLNCNSMGAVFLEAHSDCTLADFEDFRPTPHMRKLVPSMDEDTPIHQQPLLLVQVTRFSCGAICLGLGMSHVLADGQSAAHFVSEWARIARGEQPENLPFLDRRVLQLKEPPPPASFQHLEFSPAPLLIGRMDSSEERSKETTVAMLKLTKDQIQMLKNKANEAGTVKRGFTRYEAVVGHMWRCSCMARGHRGDQPTRVRIGVDIRNRLEPSLPRGYFGVAAIPAEAVATAGEIVSNPLAYASGKIRETVEKVTDEYIRSFLGSLSREHDLSKLRYSHVVGSSVGVFLGNPNLNITSWITLPLYGTDFGWGKEVYMGPAVVGYDGKSFVLPSGEEEGSFLIPTRLQVAHMDHFKKLFYHTI